MNSAGMDNWATFGLVLEVVAREFPRRSSNADLSNPPAGCANDIRLDVDDIALRVTTSFWRRGHDQTGADADLRQIALATSHDQTDITVSDFCA